MAGLEPREDLPLDSLFISIRRSCTRVLLGSSVEKHR